MTSSVSDGGSSEMSSENLAQHTYESISDVLPENYAQEAHSPSSVSEPDSNSALNNEQCDSRTLSWHEHVYRKLTTRPTPHFIENILGIQTKSSKCSDAEETLNTSKMPVVSGSLMMDSVGKLVPPQELNEPLNLSIRSDKVRPKSNSKGR